eukprot:4507148-Pyramimonas_sp.AAC.1
MSLARDRPGGPPPLRSSSHPEGLPDLSPGDALKLALALGVPVGPENPGSSWLWKQPVARRVSKRSG